MADTLHRPRLKVFASKRLREKPPVLTPPDPYTLNKLFRTDPRYNPLLNDSMDVLTFDFEVHLEKHIKRNVISSVQLPTNDDDDVKMDGDGDGDDAMSHRSMDTHKTDRTTNSNAYTKRIVCRYFLMGRCMKGTGCEFSHKMDEAKMDWCKFGTECKRRPDCPFIHIDQLENVQDCEAYDAGFCHHGPICKKRHVKCLASELPRVAQAILDDIAEWGKRAEEEEKRILYHKTSLCRMWKEGKCRRSKCTFAHGYLDLSQKGLDRLEGRSWYVDPVSKEKLYLDGHSTWWKRGGVRDDGSKKMVKAKI